MLKNISNHLQNFPGFFSKKSNSQSPIFDIFSKLSYQTRDYIDVVGKDGRKFTVKITNASKHLLNFCLNDATFAKTGKFSLTIPEIAGRIGIFCEKTIIRAFAQLKELGILRSYPRYSKNKRVCRTGAVIHVRVANCYYLTRKLLARLIEALQTGVLRLEDEPEQPNEESEAQFEKKIDQYGKVSTHRKFIGAQMSGEDGEKGKNTAYYLSEFLKNNQSLPYIEKIMRENGENNAAIQDAYRVLPQVARHLEKIGKISEYIQPDSTKLIAPEPKKMTAEEYHRAYVENGKSTLYIEKLMIANGHGKDEIEDMIFGFSYPVTRY